MTTATIDLAIAGSVGCAERTDLATAPHSVRVIDVWTLHPRAGGEPTVLAIHRAGTGYGLTLASIDPAIARAVAAADLPVDLPAVLAYDIHLAEPLPVHTDGEARQVAQQLARQTTDGSLPHRPATDDDRQAWRAVITALATVAADNGSAGFHAGFAAVAFGP